MRKVLYIEYSVRIVASAPTNAGLHVDIISILA